MPAYRHAQKDILSFMQRAYALDDIEKRKLAFLYKQSGIETRYSVIPDFSLPEDAWNFLSSEVIPLPTLEKRMQLYKKNAAALSVQAIHDCTKNKINPKEITHLITVSCTGMSAPGLDLEIMEALQLDASVYRTSVNFMGCYAAIHALKMGKMICDADAKAKVLIVSTELCTLHFQQQYTPDNAASSLLFSDGSAAVLLSGESTAERNIKLDNFYSKIYFKGSRDMAWEISSDGFLMTLSGYIPQLIEEDISSLVADALANTAYTQENITHWCIHPGGKKILDNIERTLQIKHEAIIHSRDTLKKYGNMSSPTILFVLKKMLDELNASSKPANIFGVAFGPGLTMETFTATSS